MAMVSLFETSMKGGNYAQGLLLAKGFYLNNNTNTVIFGHLSLSIGIRSIFQQDSAVSKCETHSSGEEKDITGCSPVHCTHEHGKSKRDHKND